jgi:hypothetical protein
LGVLVICGLYIIFNFEAHYKLGIIYALIAAFLSALFSVFNGIFIKSYRADVISFYQLLFGVLGITVFLFATNAFSLAFLKFLCQIGCIYYC